MRIYFTDQYAPIANELKKNYPSAVLVGVKGANHLQPISAENPFMPAKGETVIMIPEDLPADMIVEIHRKFGKQSAGERKLGLSTLQVTLQRLWG